MRKSLKHFKLLLAMDEVLGILLNHDEAIVKAELGSKMHDRPTIYQPTVTRVSAV